MITDPTQLHHRYQKLYESETGNWIADLPDWNHWLTAEERCLWVHGIPGAGKSVLISHIIDCVESHCQNSAFKHGLVYYYCYYGHTNNPDEAVPLLRWTISQLCRQANQIPKTINQAFKNGRAPNVTDLLNALEEILEHFDTVFVVVDAVDESEPRDLLLLVLKDLVSKPRFAKLQILVSSRRYEDIKRVMHEIAVPVSMSNPYVEADIRHHVHSLLQKMDRFSRWPRYLLDEVEETVSRKAEGM